MWKPAAVASSEGVTRWYKWLQSACQADFSALGAERLP
jgi:hypothetical protein